MLAFSLIRCLYMEALRLSWTQEWGAPKRVFSAGNIRVIWGCARFRHPGGHPLAKFLTCSVQVECAARPVSELLGFLKKNCGQRLV